jgi:hypothetical protein
MMKIYEYKMEYDCIQNIKSIYTDNYNFINKIFRDICEQFYPQD